MVSWQFIICLLSVTTGLTPASVNGKPRDIRETRAPFKCFMVGHFPNPYDCQSYYVCENIIDKPSNMYICPFGTSYIGGGCTIATEKCTCPSGTFWGGPSVGCIDDPEDMQSCCHDLKIDCNAGVRDEILDNNFGRNCSLTALGYFYNCHHNVLISNAHTIWVKRCDKLGKIHETRKPCNVSPSLYFRPDEKEINSDRKTNKPQPVCESLRNIIPETDFDGQEEPHCSYKYQVIPIYRDGLSYWVCNSSLKPVKYRILE